MEVLSDLLRSLRVRGSVYFCDRLEPPWRLEIRDRDRASFHLVRRGACQVRAGERVEQLAAGDLAYLGPGLDHVIESDGSGGSQNAPATLLLCGYCRFDAADAHPLVASFPSFVVVRAEELLEHPWLKGTLDHLSAEYLAQRPGAEVVVDRLTEVVLVELVRLNFCRGDASGFMRALLDKPVAAALDRLHENPGGAWTLQGLGREVGVSRAALAKRFKALVGQSMFDYLTDLRVRRARELLRDTSLPIHEVASRVGYSSELAFTKVFKNRAGTTPTRYRKDAAAPPHR